MYTKSTAPFFYGLLATLYCCGCGRYDLDSVSESNQATPEPSLPRSWCRSFHEIQNKYETMLAFRPTKRPPWGVTFSATVDICHSNIGDWVECIGHGPRSHFRSVRNQQYCCLQFRLKLRTPPSVVHMRTTISVNGV